MRELILQIRAGQDLLARLLSNLPELNKFLA